MASKLYVWAGFNMFCSSNPDASLKLTGEEIKLPTLEEMYSDHHPGGSLVQMEVETGIKKLDCTFKAKGVDTNLLTQFGLSSPGLRTFTVNQAYTDKSTGLKVGGKAIIRGRLGKIEPDASKRGEFVGHDYAINSIIHYELYFNGVEQIFWDMLSSTWRVGNTDQVADLNAILGD